MIWIKEKEKLRKVISKKIKGSGFSVRDLEKDINEYFEPYYKKNPNTKKVIGKSHLFNIKNNVKPVTLDTLLFLADYFDVNFKFKND